MAKSNHTHKFIRVIGKFTYIWRCASGDCKYTLYPAQEEFLIGRKTVCWNCDKEFQMGETNLKQEMPICLECHLAEKGITFNEMLVEVPSSTIDSE